MNDRFKFRIWHKPLKTMHYNDFIITATGYMAKIYQQDDYMMKFNQEDLEFDKQCIVMQCTGLKDKNGKLIYEGDIVNYDDRDLDPWHTPILNAVIEMRKYQWCMVYYRKDIINADTRKPAEQKTWLGFDYFISSRIEVIGNIYENKELLDERN